MGLVLVLALVVLVPIALLVWTRRGAGRGVEGHDPQAHRDLGARGGPPTHTQGDGWGGVGGDL